MVEGMQALFFYVTFPRGYDFMTSITADSFFLPFFLIGKILLS